MVLRIPRLDEIGFAGGRTAGVVYDGPVQEKHQTFTGPQQEETVP